MRLTERKIETLTVERGRRDRLVFDDQHRGLAVRVTASGGRTYLCQYTLHGKKWRVPLGAFSGLSLAKAREAAAAVMGEVAQGRNPASERKEAAVALRARMARDRLTLAALIDDWKRLHLAQRRERYAVEAVRALRYAFKRHLGCPAEDLDRATVVRVLDGLTRRRDNGAEAAPARLTGRAMAARTAAYGRAAFSWAVRRGTVRVNPFDDLPVAARTEARDRWLTDNELVAVWRAAREMSAPYGVIVRLLILTGQRVSEVANMAWSELAGDLCTWAIPGARTKNGTPHIVPLNEPAGDLLRSLLPDDVTDLASAVRDRGNALALPGMRETPFSGWSKAKIALDEASGVTNWRLHDLRRTLATGMQRLGVRLEVTEAVLNHISGSRAGIVGVYQRHDWAKEKREALEAWAGHLISCIEGQAPRVNVVSLR